MTIATDADGYMTGIGDATQEVYLAYADGCQHPALSASTAKTLVQHCPEDAWTQHPASGRRVRRERSDAMDSGNLLDALLTGPAFTAGEVATFAPATKTKSTPSVDYRDWNGLRLVYTESWQTAAAKQCRADGWVRGLTVVKAEDFEREQHVADELRVRMELVGVDFSQGHRQVPIYWVEHATDGTPVQCRGLLDWMRLVTEQQGDAMLAYAGVVDLKRVESLRGETLTRSIESYGWHIQAAAYMRGARRAVSAHLGGCCSATADFRWLFARTSPSVAVRCNPIGSTMQEIGEFYWLAAVDEWARGLRTKLWRGWESDSDPIEATPWQLAAMEARRQAEESAESEAAQ